MKKKLPVSIVELVIYSLAGLLGIWGLVYIALGVSCVYIDYKSALYEADLHLKETTGQLGFLLQGIIILASAVLVLVVTLLITAKKSDREFEKAQRRAARLAKGNAPVDVEATPVE